jgi:hypothetical protein
MSVKKERKKHKKETTNEREEDLTQNRLRPVECLGCHFSNPKPAFAGCNSDKAQ